MLSVLILLIFAHFLCDYPLQGNYLSMSKNRHVLEDIDYLRKEHGEIPSNYKPKPKWKEWPWSLTAHATIHGGAVYLITGMWYLALAELISHWIIDDAKCGGKLTYNQDQIAHIACKVLWAGIYVFIVT